MHDNNTATSIDIVNSTANGILSMGRNTVVLRSTFRSCGTCILFNNSGGFVDDSKFYDSYYGVYSVGNDSRIKSSEFWNMDYAAYMIGNNSMFSESNIYNVSSDALYFEGGTVKVFENAIDYTYNGIVYHYNKTYDVNSSVHINFTRIWHNFGHGMLLNSSNTQVYNGSIYNSTTGLEIPRKNASFIIDNTYFDYCTDYGIIVNAENATLTRNSIQNSGTGIHLGGRNQTAGHNTLNNCTMGINITSNFTRVYNNLLKGNNWSFSPIGHLTNLSFENNSLIRNSNGTLRFNGTVFTLIKNNTINENFEGLILNNTQNISVSWNSFFKNGFGIFSNHTINMTVDNNTFTDTGIGLEMNDSLFNIISDCTSNSNVLAMDLNNINNTIFQNNEMNGNKYGVNIAGFNTTIIGNTFFNTEYDLNLTGNNRSTTKVYHNNFYTSIIAAENASLWGLGYPLGGNYYHFSNRTDNNCTSPIELITTAPNGRM
jgi:hypothetical protein